MRIHAVLAVLILSLAIFTVSVGASVSDSTVVNTNVYASSYVYNIAPAANVTSSTATDISSVANRYLYTSALDNRVTGSTATLILTDRQGAVVNLTNSAVVSGISVDWGDGSTSDSLTHEYAADGIYNISATLTNYLDQTGITLTDRVQIGETAISISVSPATLSTGQSWTLTANAVIAESVQWQVSRNNASWTDIPAGTYTPTEYGEYYFRAIAYGLTAVTSNIVQTEYLYAVSDSIVTNTNIYAGSNSVSIAPSGYYDSASTASGISSVANRYVYASGLQNTVNESTTTLILTDRQGAVVNLTDSGVVSGISVDWGDGSTSDSLTHTYAADGIYNVSLTATNYLDQTGITLTDRVQIGETSISITVGPNTLTTGQSWTLTANAVIADSIQWQVSRNNASWTNIPAGTYTPSEYGTYYFRAIAYGADSAAYSNVEQTTYQYAVSDSTVTNTNVYATSNVFDIAPSGYYDAASTASGITNVAGRYLYASALEVIENGRTAKYIIIGLQGSTTTLTDGRITQGYLWDFGDGTISTTTQLSHTYGAPGTYVTTLGLTNYLDSTGVSLTGNPMYVGPYIGDITADKTAGGVGDVFNLTIDATNYTSIDWFYSKSSTGQWIVISGEHSDTLSYTPGKTGYWYVRAKATNSTTGFSAYTEPITITVWPSPTISQTSITPNQGSLTQTVTLSASVVDNAGGTTYQWQTSSDGSTWSNISGATTATWVGTLNLQQAGKYLYRLIASGIGGTTTSNIIAYQAYAPPVFAKLESSASIVALPASVTLTAYASDTNTYTWQELRNGQWVNIGSGGKIYQQITSAGNHTYRVIASGFGGTTTSQTLTVDAGYLPSVVINSPENGFKVKQNETITVIATVQNADSYTWNFGNNEHYETISGTTAEVRYPKSSSNVVSITAVNKYGSVTKSITIIVMYDFNRPTVNTTIDRLDTSDLTDWMDSLNPDHDSQMPDIMGIFGKMLSPYTQAIGSWMYLILFAVPYLIIWIRQKNTIIPSILGVLFGVWILVQFPTSAVLPAAGILVLSISGGVYGIYVKFQR